MAIGNMKCSSRLAVPKRQCAMQHYLREGVLDGPSQTPKEKSLAAVFVPSLWGTIRPDDGTNRGSVSGQKDILFV